MSDVRSCSSVGSFSLWFGPLFNALRCDAVEEVRSAASSSVPFLHARDLLLAILGLSGECKAMVQSMLVEVNRGERLKLNTPRLSSMDMADLLEHCPDASTGQPTVSWVTMLQASLTEEGCKGDLRLLMSLIDSGADVLQGCVERLCRHAPSAAASPPQPSSPTVVVAAPPATPRPIPVVAVTSKRPAEIELLHHSPPLSHGARVERGSAPTFVQHPSPVPASAAVPASATSLSTAVPSSLSPLLKALLWQPPVVCSPAVAALLAKPRGSDAKPPGPLDPQHPQRVMESTPSKLVKRMMKDPSAGGFFADLKYDGERLIGFREEGHHSAVSYKFYSRNMLDVPDRKLDGIRELLDAAFQGNDVVFDGEILSMHTFGSMNEVHKGIISVSGPRIYVFDLLYWNGHSLVSLPLTTRKELLHRVLTVTKNVSMSMCYWIPSGGAADSNLQSVFDDAMTKRLEGYVLKPATSLYRYSGTDWVKLKKGYMAGDTDKAGVAGFVLFPGGPRIRRVDGVDVTTLAHGGGGAALIPVAAAPAAMVATAPPARVGGAATVAARHRLYTPLVDTLDCLAVGLVRLHGKHGPRIGGAEGTTPALVLLGVFDACKNRIVTIGVVADPNLFCHLHSMGTGALSIVAPTSPKVGFRCGVTLLVQPALIAAATVLVNLTSAASELQVLEASGKGLVEDPQHSCLCAITRGGVVVRPRDDKSFRSANTLDQVAKLFAYAVPTSMSEVAGTPAAAPALATPMDAAIKAFNDQHWCALPTPSRVGIVTPKATVVEGTRSAAIAAKEAAQHAGSGVVHAVLVAVAARSKWIDKGTMRDVSTAFGASVGELCNARLAPPSASSGDVVVMSPSSGVLCFIAAVMQLVSPYPNAPKRAALEDATVLDITLVRVFAFLASLAARKGAAQVCHIAVHVDASSPSEAAVWGVALDSMLSAVVLGCSPSLRMEAFIYQRYKS